MPRSRGVILFLPMAADLNYFNKKIFTIYLFTSILLVTTGRGNENSTVLDLGSQIFNEAPSVFTGLNNNRLVSSSRSCWIGREVSATFDQPALLAQPFSMQYRRSLITVCPSLRVKCHGEVASWRITLTVADRNPINFAIFRSTQDTAGQRFTMIGYNTFSAGPLGRVVFEVPESKRLTVKPGDIFGYFRMGIGQPEFIGYVSVDSPSNNNQNQGETGDQRLQAVTGNYDSCYQLPMTYIDLIKANYKITIDSNAQLLKRLYSLAAVVEASNSSVPKSSFSPQKRSGRGNGNNHVRISQLKGEVAARARLVHMKQQSNARKVSSSVSFSGNNNNGPPQPVSPFQRWRQYTALTVTTQASLTTKKDQDFQRYLHGPQLDHVPPPTSFTLSRQISRRRVKAAPGRTSNSTFRAFARQANTDDNGLIWCGEPPTIENAYSVNEIVPQIRLPTRSYACQSGYTPVGYNRVFCDPSSRKWTPITFQCVFTIVMEDPPTTKRPDFIPDLMATYVITPASPSSSNNRAGPLPGGPDPTLNSCLFPPIIDNGYAIRQDDITVVYRCYPGFLKVGQVDQDGSTCDRVTNVWTPPLVSCVLGRNTVTIPLAPWTTPTPPTNPPPPPIYVQPGSPPREVLVMPELVTAPPRWRTLPPAIIPPAPEYQPEYQLNPQPKPSMIAIPDRYLPAQTVTIPYEIRPITPPLPPPQVVDMPNFVLQPQQQPSSFIVPSLHPILPPQQQQLQPQPQPQQAGPSSVNVMDCGVPPRIANGRYYQDPDPYYPAKSYIYECYTGYVMRGQPVIFCNPYYGRFTQLTARCDPIGLEVTLPPTPPTTTKRPIPDELADCGTPPPIANAFTVTGGRRASAVYLCLPGYTGFGIAEIQCVPPSNDDDPGRGPTWGPTSFQCVLTSQVTAPAPATTTMRTTTTTTPEPTTEFQPFIIIPGPRRIPPTTPSPPVVYPPAPPRNQQWVVWPPQRQIETTQAPSVILPALIPNQPQIPPLFPNNGNSDSSSTNNFPSPQQPFVFPNFPNMNQVQLVTPPPMSMRTQTILQSWQNLMTLQPTKWSYMAPPTPPPTPPPLRDTPEPTRPAWLTPPDQSNSGGIEGTCQVYQTCGEPPQVANAQSEPSYSGRHACPGDYVRFICDDGYRLDSLISAVFCSQATYSWSPNKPPQCMPKK